MPSIPKPRRLQVLHGNPSKRRLRDEVEIPLSDRFENPPPFDGLSEYAAEAARMIWHEVAPLLIEAMVLADSDYRFLEVFCSTFGGWRDALRVGDVRAERWGRLDLLAMSAKLGLNPADRLRLAIPGPRSGREPAYSSILD